MANGPKDGARKRRTREHVIADLAVNYVERFALLCGYTMHRVVHDYGLDAAITTYSPRGEIENGVIWLQIKATDNRRQRKQFPVVSTRVQRKDLLYWSGELYPVILIVYDASTDQAYWLHIQNELRAGKVFEMARSRATLTLEIPHGQRLSKDAIREFRRLKGQSLAAW